MIAWLLLFLVWLAFLARSYQVVLRRWKTRPEALRPPANWGERQQRHFLRANVPIALLFNSFLGFLFLSPILTRVHGVLLTILSWVGLLIILVFIAAAVLGSLIWRFNRPRALVPPALRGDLGTIGDFLARRRERRGRH